NDDSSVQLLPEPGSAMYPSGESGDALMPIDGMRPAGEFPPYAEQVGPPGMVGPMAPPNMPMAYPPGMMGYPTGGSPEQADRARLSADVELSLLRPQITENAVGRYSEEFQFSPRVILGFRSANNLEARVRYWHYDHDTQVLDSFDNIGLK